MALNPAGRIRSTDFLLMVLVFVALLIRILLAPPIWHHGEAREGLVVQGIVHGHLGDCSRDYGNCRLSIRRSDGRSQDRLASRRCPSGHPAIALLAARAMGTMIPSPASPSRLDSLQEAPQNKRRARCPLQMAKSAVIGVVLVDLAVMLANHAGGSQTCLHRQGRCQSAKR
jgi:hypothetical protein